MHQLVKLCLIVDFADTFEQLRDLGLTVQFVVELKLVCDFFVDDIVDFVISELAFLVEHIEIDDAHNHEHMQTDKSLFHFRQKRSKVFNKRLALVEMRKRRVKTAFEFDECILKLDVELFV